MRRIARDYFEFSVIVGGDVPGPTQDILRENAHNQQFHEVSVYRLARWLNQVNITTPNLNLDFANREPGE